MDEGSPLFIAKNASIIGDVTLSKGVSIWHGAVLRADINSIEIGENSNIQDNCVIHVEEDLPVEIGPNVTVGHNAVIHGAEISSYVLIGMGAIVMNEVKIGKGSIIGAGAVVTENSEIPPFSLVLGVPGKVVRENDRSVIEEIESHAIEYMNIAESASKRQS